MRTYSVFAPELPVNGDDLEIAESFRFVRHGVSFLALLLPLVWMLLRRLWVVLLLYVVAVVAIQVLGLVLSPLIAGGLSLALALVLFFEAGTILMASARMKGYREIAVIEAANQEAAERQFFEKWLDKRVADRGRSAPAHQPLGRAENGPTKRLMRPGSTAPPPLPGFGQ